MLKKYAAGLDPNAVDATTLSTLFEKFTDIGNGVDRLLGSGCCDGGHRLATFQAVQMPLRFDAEVSHDEVDRVGFWKRAPVNLLVPEILEYVLSAPSHALVHLADNS